MLLKAWVVWLVIVAAEFVHGAARMWLLVPSLGDLRARQISVFTGSLIILAIAVIFAPWIGATRVTHLLGIGALWVALMVAFELALGRFVFGYSWERIGSDYDPTQGGLLWIGMIFLLLAPLIAAKLRGLI